MTHTAAYHQGATDLKKRRHGWHVVILTQTKSRQEVMVADWKNNVLDLDTEEHAEETPVSTTELHTCTYTNSELNCAATITHSATTNRWMNALLRPCFEKLTLEYIILIRISL